MRSAVKLYSIEKVIMKLLYENEGMEDKIVLRVPVFCTYFSMKVTDLSSLNSVSKIVRTT